MPRTIVDIPLTQLRDLDARCASLGISRAEGVRRAIETFLSDTAVVSAFGLWAADGEVRARQASAADGAD